MTVALPPDVRGLGERSRVVLGLSPVAWYADHVAQAEHILVNPGWSSRWWSCGCREEGPDRACDVGEALWRLRKQPFQGVSA